MLWEWGDVKRPKGDSGRSPRWEERVVVGTPEVVESLVRWASVRGKCFLWVRKASPLVPRLPAIGSSVRSRSDGEEDVKSAKDA
jgi:hypothetical protein